MPSAQVCSTPSKNNIRIYFSELEYDSAEETDAAEPLRLRMRRVCTSVCGTHGCQINCQRMKREDLAILDAALSVYEDG